MTEDEILIKTRQVIDLHLRGEFEAAADLIDATPELSALREQAGIGHAEFVTRLMDQNATGHP